MATIRMGRFSLALLAAAAFAALAGEVRAFSVGIHEDITREALSFLRDGVLEDVENEHGDWADADDAKDYKWVHMDSCAFGEAVQQVNEFYRNAVDNLVPGPAFEPWSASDDFGRVFHPAQDFYSHSNWVELGFPVNDDPATVSVIEGMTTADLVDFATTFAGPSGLGPWGEPGPFGTMRGDILLDDTVLATLANVDNEGALDLVDVNGDGIVNDADATVVPIPAEWNLGLLPHPTIPGNAGFVPGIDVDGDATFSYVLTPGLPVPVLTGGVDYRFLISAIGGRPVSDVYGNQCDPFRRNSNGVVIVPHEPSSCQPPVSSTPTGPVSAPDDYSCIAYHGSRFALTHDGTDRSELNKDSPGEAPTRHPKARALATLQSRYEWCRFVHQAGVSGGDGVLLSLWVDESESANLHGTPCNPGPDVGPIGVTVAIDRVEVLDDGDIDEDEPGEINLSLALYDSPFAFHRLVKSKTGPVYADDDGSSRPSVIPTASLPAPLTQCVGTSDGTFRIALHGWDDDEGNDDGAEDEANGDFDQHGSFPGSANVDDALVGLSATLVAADFPIGTTKVLQTAPAKPGETRHLQVTYSVTRVADVDSDDLDACGESFYGTSPSDSDTDFDYVLDGMEVAAGISPLSVDSDADGLYDGIDPDWLRDAIAALPITAVKGGEGRRNAMRRLVAATEAQVHAGRWVPAARKLGALRRRVDGCGAAPAAGRNDWIIDCEEQLEIRSFLDVLVKNLTRPS